MFDYNDKSIHGTNCQKQGLKRTVEVRLNYGQVFLEAGRKRDHQLNKAALHLRLLNNKAVGKVFSSLKEY